MKLPDSVTLRCPLDGAEHEIPVTYEVKASGATITVTIAADAATILADHIAGKHFQIETSDGVNVPPPALHHEWVNFTPPSGYAPEQLRVCKNCWTPRDEDTILQACDPVNRKHAFLTKKGDFTQSRVPLPSCVWCGCGPSTAHTTCPGPNAGQRATILEGEALDA